MKKKLNMPPINKIRDISSTSILIILYVFTYEWGIIEALPIALVYAFKFFIPVILFFKVKFVKINQKYYNLFIIYFLFFLIWSIVPNIIGGTFLESNITWFKFLPRFVFFLLASMYLLQNPKQTIILIKVFIIIGILFFVQYILLMASQYFGIYLERHLYGRGVYYGPFGLLGNVASAMHFSAFPIPIFRLTGFWLEPSNASGYLAAMYFLSIGIYSLEKNNYWKKISYFLLIATLLCFSNAGYLALLMPVFYGAIINIKTGKKVMRSFLFINISIGLILTILVGRLLVAEYAPENDTLKAIVGLRKGVAEDFTSGRATLVEENLKVLSENPLGIGFRIAEVTEYGTGFSAASGTAPIMWMTYTGLIGLLLLLSREKQLLFGSIKYNKYSEFSMRMTQAWIAMFAQNMIYGTWMGPMYLLLCIFVFNSIYNIEIYRNRKRLR